ncbi:MAG: hypothetical protein V3R84_00670 [Acidimicrobiia bacterium]
MRLLWIAALGGLTYLSWVLSATAAGMAAAAAFAITPLVAALTVGALVVALAKSTPRLQTRAGSGDCSSCRQSIGQIGALWMCAICDRAPVQA